MQRNWTNIAISRLIARGYAITRPERAAAGHYLVNGRHVTTRQLIDLARQVGGNANV